MKKFDNILKGGDLRSIGEANKVVKEVNNQDGVTDDTTYVVIKNYGFNLTGDDLIQAVKDNTGGFTTVLDGLKAYLEHNIKLNLVGDKYPKEVSNHDQ